MSLQPTELARVHHLLNGPEVSSCRQGRYNAARMIAAQDPRIGSRSIRFFLILSRHMGSRKIASICEEAGLDADTKVKDLDLLERRRLVHALAPFPTSSEPIVHHEEPTLVA